MNEGRTVSSLNLNWRFHRGDEPRAWYKGHDDADWRSVTLPHDWSVEEPFSKEHSSGTGYLPGGIGWYRKRFELPPEAKGRKVYITFEGVYNNAQVWCNSYYLGKRPYGYSSFTYDLTDFIDAEGGGNVISVKVDHKDVADSRWFTGSGIYRDVYLTITDPIHIAQYGVFVTTPEVTSQQATVAVSVRASNETADDADVQIRNTLRDATGRLVGSATSYTIAMAESDAVTEQAITVSEPKLWSPDAPYLYELLTEVIKDGEVVDQLQTPVGIRWFAFDGEQGFFLNDVPTTLKGVCVHHDAGGLGAAVPEKVWVRRLEALKAMGCNAIRTSHNPPAPNLLDLCDRMGFLVMDEAFDEWEGVKNKWSTGHNVYPPKHYGYYEDFPQWGETDIKEMVLRDRNHPSIILWSIGNEVDYPNDPYCHPFFDSMTGNNDANKPTAERQYDPNKPNAERLAVIARRLVGYVKECDTTRPVTAALAFPELSNLTGYADALDVVGYNYKEHLYEADLRQYPGRVLYGSENSSSLEAWLAVRDNPAISGQFIWTGIDYLGEARGWPVRAAGSGFLDLAGFPKAGYYYRQSLWSSEPMAFLAVARAGDPALHEKRRWGGGDSHWNWAAGDRLEVICYTNCEEAELWLNGRSLGVRRLQEAPRRYLAWEVDFEEGAIKVEARSAAQAPAPATAAQQAQDAYGDGIAKSSFELVTASEPTRLAISADSAELQADGQDIAHLELQVVDGEGRPVYLADHPIQLTIEGPGEIIGLENGDVQDLEPYSSRTRKAYRGKLLAFVRAGTEAGEIIVTASSPGLASAQAAITAQSLERKEESHVSPIAE